MTAQVRPEDLAGLRRLETTGAVQLVQAGVSISPDGLWFNLTPGANKDRPWLQSEELRRAISYAVDRQAFADTVFLGAAKPIYGPITPGNPRVVRAGSSEDGTRRRAREGAARIDWAD